ncbi:hypothetical protein [Desulfoluna sp.]|uniref:hypothetical protein n=1 Tax=Desulfoluna sp. TaxID=2045199 RepID=UPI002620805D|nr:hypothetical protein [Desulfoluna sp.]
MKHIPHAVTNEEGSVLLLTLVLLILFTVAGLGLLSTTNTELKITQNDRCFKQNLTRAESAVMEAAQLIAYYDDTAASPESNLKPTGGNPLLWIEASGFDPFVDGQWRTAPDGANPQTAQASQHFTDTLSGYTAVYEGIAPGASLDVANPTMRQYAIVGRAEQCNGLVDVIAGYRIRF